jgi:hypothetical protein
MRAKYNRVLVACPGGAMTAGPEALHQLVSDLNRLGQSAAIIYFPFSSEFETPEPYKKYGASIANYRDESGDLLIFPEIVTTYALKVKNAKAAIWWMSVNNYTCNRYGNPLRDKFRYFKNLLRGLRPWGGIKALSHLQHFAQSYYALDFLKSNKIHGELLSDSIPVYTESSYIENLEKLLSTGHRENVILYNPKKGTKAISSLKNAYPNWKFLALEGFNREELADKFINSKIYVDFGHHPGKDRLPREAAIHGCCVITGLLGSAANNLDVNIPSKYKIDQKPSDFITEFGDVVQNIFENFDIASADFSIYRNTIQNEQELFDQQIRAIFES